MERSRRHRRIKWSKLYTFSCLKQHERRRESGDVDASSLALTRVVLINSPEEEIVPYPSNWVSTTKYNVVTFFPKSLFEQFRRVANIYFLLAAVLSLTPLSPFTASSLIAPLVFVVGVSMLKEAIEDWHRYLQDKEVNNRMVQIHQGDGTFAPKEWEKVRVGDIVKVEKDDFFPADLLLLSSSFEDGICYVETMNLDGETNLKLKRALEKTMHLSEIEQFKSFSARIVCEDPNPQLYSFIGNLDLPDEETLPLGPQQILLRDSKLRNTEYIYGAVIFTGHDTKVMQNATPPPSKRSNIERRMDRIIYFLFSVLILISAVGSVVFGIVTWKETPRWWYLRPDDSNAYFNPKKPFVAALLHFITALILYGYLIPISLYVSIEIVKVGQVMFINQDVEMYYEEKDQPARARTSNLNEELGQIHTILSDKTGTLTCNQMDFVKCSISGVSYGQVMTEVEIAVAERERSRDLDQISNDGIADQTPYIKGFNFKDSRLTNSQWTKEPNASEIELFLRILAICNTVVPEQDENGKINYEAESPDEAAFAVAAQELGFELIRRSQSSVWVKELDVVCGEKVTREYKILQLLEFSSARKRMSVVVKDEEDNIFVFSKGADSVMFRRLRSDGRKYEEATRAHLAHYAAAGLRTLVLAYRKLDLHEYESWLTKFMEAKTSISIDREEKLEEAADLIEKDLILIGATAVEDKLQKGVPECIRKLSQAGIKIWVLTGDKLETAINIGFACGLLHPDMAQLIISLENDDVKRAEASGDRQHISRVSLENTKQQLLSCKEHCEEEDRESYALIIDGNALSYALGEELQGHLIDIAIRCTSVICCRVSPKQKAVVTKLVKRSIGGITLAIGDGANDVGMIQEAHVGVGIAGVEGMQATMASDFAIAQFCYLERLLLVHGSWCYERIAHMICYFFYKNIHFGFTLFYYEAYTAFSGQAAYNDWYMSLFNVFFTSLPVIALGVLEQDIPAQLKLQFPRLYERGIKNLQFRWARILAWMFFGVSSSAIVFFLTISILKKQAFRKGGQVSTAEELGVVLYTCVIWTVNCQLAMVIKYFTLLQHICIWGSIFLWYLFMIVYGYIPSTISTTAYKVFVEACAPAPLYWLTILLVTTAALTPSFIYKTFQQTFCPMDDQIVLEHSKFTGRRSSMNGAHQNVQSSQELQKLGDSTGKVSPLRSNQLNV